MSCSLRIKETRLEHPIFTFAYRAANTGCSAATDFIARYIVSATREDHKHLCTTIMLLATRYRHAKKRAGHTWTGETL